MRRHRFRWDSLAFGAFFAAIVGNWAVWKEDLLTPRELTLAASGVLIFLGVLGIAATLWQARPARTVIPTAQPDSTTDTTDTTDTTENPTPTTPEGHDDEEA